MAEPSERSRPVLAWRQRNRDEGLRPISAWVPVYVKFLLEDLASQRRQSLGEVIADALHAWQPGTSSPTSSHLEQLIQKEVAKQRHKRQHGTPSAPVLPRPTPPHSTEATPQSTPESKKAVEERILELHNLGFSNPRIAALLNDEGVPTFKGGRWQQGTCGKIVRRLQRQQ